MGASFYIKPNDKGISSIFCAIKYDGTNRFVVKIPNSSIDKKEWNKGGMKLGKGKQENSHIQNSLNDFKKKLDDFVREFVRVNDCIPNKADFIDYLSSNKKLDNYFQKTEIKEIIPLFKEILEKRRTGKLLNKGKRFGTRSLDSHKSVIEKIEEFSKKKKIKITNLNVTNKELVLGFENYMTIDLEHKLNTIGNNLKTFKSYLEVLRKTGIISFNPFVKYEITIPKEESVGIALDDGEMKELNELDLSENPRLDVVRDQFLVLCWTGLRISDFKSFNEIPKDDDIITITNKKTGEEAHIPIFPKTKEILKKYDGKFPKTISEQNMNNYLKEIGLMIKGLERSIEVTYTKGGLQVKEIKKRNELLSLHVGRRTLSTHLASIGIPYHEIMLITGHKSLKNFQIYIKVNKKNVLNSLISRVTDLEQSKLELEKSKMEKEKFNQLSATTFATNDE